MLRYFSSRIGSIRKILHIHVNMYVSKSIGYASLTAVRNRLVRTAVRNRLVRTAHWQKVPWRGCVFIDKKEKTVQW